MGMLLYAAVIMLSSSEVDTKYSACKGLEPSKMISDAVTTRIFNIIR